VVPSELGYGYFCSNIVGEDDAWVSKYLQSFYCPYYLSLMTHELSFLAAYKKNGRRSRAARNFLMRFKGKELRLAREPRAISFGVGLGHFKSNLLYKSFESRHEAWCVTKVKQLKDPMYLEEQRKQQKKVEEEERFAWEAEQHRRRNDPTTWEYHIAKAKEKNRHAREVEREGMTSKTWPPPRPEKGTFLRTLCKFEDLWLHLLSFVHCSCR
jgi:hypothetical protein